MGKTVPSTSRMKLLWKNPNPGAASFAEQSIDLDLSPYDFLIVTAASDVTYAQAYGGYSVSVGHVGKTNAITALGNYITRRSYVADNSGISFKGAVIVNTYGSQQSNNAVCIPIEIYGVIL